MDHPEENGGQGEAGQREGLEAFLETGRLLFAQECKFVSGASSVASLPAFELPEIAFAGRSNVGKSSLINALVGQNALARTSQQPGRTQQINFFDLGGRLMLVDLPGYGYAKAPKHQVAGWTKLIQSYLKGRPPLRRTLVLVDSRHGLKDSDRDAMTMLDGAAQPYQIVLTKADRIGVQARRDIVAKVAAELRPRPAAHPDIAVTSSSEGLGIAELRAELTTLALGKTTGPKEERI